MKKQFVTVVSGSHLDWSAKDWERTWAKIMKKIDVDGIDMDNHDLLFLKEIHFVDWSIYMGVDPVCDIDFTKIVILEKQWNSLGCNFPLGDVARANALEKAHRADRDEEMRKNLRSFGVSEKNFIVRDGKTFINSPEVDLMVGVKL